MKQYLVVPASKKHLKRLSLEGTKTPTYHRSLGERNSKLKGFNEKFHHPRSERVHESIPPTPWGQFLQAWRGRHKLYAKEAASELGIPFDTYRGWEAGKHTPQIIVQQEITKRAAAWKPK